jgi:hypothetical protein
LNLPTSVVITGIDSLDILEQALTAARTYQPLSAEDVDRLLAKTKMSPEADNSNRSRQRRYSMAQHKTLSGLVRSQSGFRN